MNDRLALNPPKLREKEGQRWKLRYLLRRSRKSDQPLEQLFAGKGNVPDQANVPTLLIGVSICCSRRLERYWVLKIQRHVQRTQK